MGIIHSGADRSTFEMATMLFGWPPCMFYACNFCFSILTVLCTLQYISLYYSLLLLLPNGFSTFSSSVPIDPGSKYQKSKIIYFRDDHDTFGMPHNVEMILIMKRWSLHCVQPQHTQYIISLYYTLFLLLPNGPILQLVLVVAQRLPERDDRPR